MNNRCLNSTMVRLKLNKEQQYKINVKKSQFHYGSIKTLREVNYEI